MTDKVCHLGWILLLEWFLQNIESDEIRYFIPYNKALRHVIGIIKRIVLAEIMLLDRPKTKWKLIRITNIRFVVTLTNFPLSCTRFPRFLNKRRGLRFLVSNPNDNLFFRCLAVHRIIQDIDRWVEIIQSSVVSIPFGWGTEWSNSFKLISIFFTWMRMKKPPISWYTSRYSVHKCLG